MEALRIASSTIATPSLIKPNSSAPIFRPTSIAIAKSRSPFTHFPKSRNCLFTPLASTQPISPPPDHHEEDDKFDWFSHWYAVMPVCDLDKRAPVGKRVMGLDVVVWWDKDENAWKVFDDKCPHRLAPLSQGRIDQWGRLQCVYHGWCFRGSGDCNFIPQAPPDGPPVHSFPKACVGVYPSMVQNGIVWFWPSTDPQYKDIIRKKKPPYVPELDDPAFAHTTHIYNRDIAYGYEVLVENILDPSHVPYSHHGVFKISPTPRVKLDREGGSPIDIVNTTRIEKSGFTSFELPNRKWKFVPPCLVVGTTTFTEHADDPQDKFAEKPPRKALFIFFCIPVSPGKSRLISAGYRNFNIWKDLFEQRWMHHMLVNLIIDSDFYLVRLQDEKLRNAGNLNWQNICFVPTKADAMVVAFRKWLKKYAGGQIDWGNKFNGFLLEMPPKEQLMDRYRSHVMSCKSCNDAYKGLNALQITLQMISVASVVVTAATKHSMAVRNAFAGGAILCFVGSKLLSRYIYKNFHFHDYNHAFK